MSTVISGNMVGGAAAPLKTVILEDENGNQFIGVCVESVQVFDATPSDVKIGKTFVADNGVEKGTDTKTYRTEHSSYLIFPGENFSIWLEEYNQYDYTKFQAIVAKFNTSFEDSVNTDKVSINDNIYAVNSTDILSNITKNSTTKTVDFNIVNDTDDIYVVHFNTYREE